MKMNKIDEVWNSVNLLLKWIFSLLPSKNFSAMAMWRNDFLSINEALLGWVCLSVVWISKPVNFTNYIEEELAM